MTFRPPAGPPASARLVQQLLSLVKEAGYTDFRGARGPLGLTQRQGSGKFTSDEAEALVERLELEAAETQPAAETSSPVSDRPLEGASTETLVTELQLRGWSVTKE